MPRMPPPKQIEEDEDEIIEEEEDEEEEETPFDLVEAMSGIDVAERATIYGLRGVTAQIRALHKQMKAEAAALELKLATDSAPLFEERRKIIAGEREPTAEEIAAGTDAQASTIEEVPEEDDKKAAPAKKARVVTPAEASKPETGIPDFWLTAMKNHEVLESLITERDSEALSFLKDIKCEFIDGVPEKGFVIRFFFAENPFFTDAELTKKYIMDSEDPEVLDKSEGCTINWTSSAKNLTIEIKQKKQRSKTGKGVRVVQREEKVPSFFRFFAPIDPEADIPENEEEDSPDLDPDFDYEAGMAFRDGIVPRAVFYYTGEALAQLASGFNFGDDDDEEYEEEEEEEEEEEVPVRGKKGGPSPAPKGPPAAGAPGKQPECKQQ